MWCGPNTLLLAVSPNLIYFYDDLSLIGIRDKILYLKNCYALCILFCIYATVKPTL